jgi:hypothetical protein
VADDASWRAQAAAAAQGKAAKKSKPGKKDRKGAKGGGFADGGQPPPFCGQVFECVKAEALAALAQLEPAAGKEATKGAAAGKGRAAKGAAASAAAAAADSLCGLLLALGSLGPWLAASGRGKELASWTRALMLPAADPSGFDPTLARLGQPPTASGGAGSFALALAPAPSSKKAAAAAAAAAAASSPETKSGLYVNKYVCAHALWCVYKCGAALPDTLNAAVLDAALHGMAKLDYDDDDDDDAEEGGSMAEGSDEERFEDAHGDGTSVAESTLGDSLNGSIMGGDSLNESMTSGVNEGEVAGEADEAADGCGCWKPVRVAAAHVLFQLLQTRYPQEQLRLVLARVIGCMIAAAEAEQSVDGDGDPKGLCSGLPMRVGHLVAEVAEDDLLPHMDALSKVLAAQCLLQLREGADMAESVALEALGMLAATLLHLLDREEADDADGDDEEGEADEADEVVAKGVGAGAHCPARARPPLAHRNPRRRRRQRGPLPRGRGAAPQVGALSRRRPRRRQRCGRGQQGRRGRRRRRRR